MKFTHHSAAFFVGILIGSLDITAAIFGDTTPGFRLLLGCCGAFMVAFTGWRAFNTPNSTP
jgi:hypothetical protein